jgi:hypothetical protein
MQFLQANGQLKTGFIVLILMFCDIGWFLFIQWGNEGPDYADISLLFAKMGTNFY